MPKFSMTSKSRLETCHVDLQILFNEVVKHFDCSILEGHRSQEKQDKAYREGKSQLKYPASKHNSKPSMAVDVAPYDKHLKGIDWSDNDRFYLFAGFVLGTAQQLLNMGLMTHSLAWGGDWDGDTEVKDNGFDDLVHFNLEVPK